MAALAITLSACSGTGGTVRIEPPQPEDTAIERPPEITERATVPAAPAPESAEPKTQAVAPAARERGPEEALIQFGKSYLDLSPEARRQEFLQSEARYLRDANARNLLRYAMLAALNGVDRPGANRRVRTDLRALIEQANGDEESEELVPLAHVLLHIIEERDALLGQLTAKNETLQRKLDELKDIERQLRDRAGPEPEPIQPLQNP